MDHYKHHSIDISHVTQIVLDEADEMLNMGFYKDVRHIIEMMKARKPSPCSRPPSAAR